MGKTPAELASAAAQYEPLRILIDETNHFADASILHSELERFAWTMIKPGQEKSGQDVALALMILFYPVKKDETAEEDYGSISVAFESRKLIDIGLPAISEKFVFEVNQHLVEIETQKIKEGTNDSIDAFGIPFQAIEEPMPSVKLAGGFEATIRTMFKEQRCQSRYGRIENASYPISPSMRMQLQSALEWAGGAEREKCTWINTEQNEILFAYPSRLPDIPISYVELFGQSEDEEMAFPDKAEKFIQELQQPKTAETDPKSEQISIFILRRLNVKNNSGRTKVLYTRQTDAFELEKCSMAWADGCANLPDFPFGTSQTPYPLDAVDILNRFWKQDAKIATDKFKPIPKCHGLELLMEPALSVTVDLHRLTESAMNLGAYLGNLCARGDLSHPIWENMKDMLAMMGLFLYRRHIGKEQYMENLPFLYGQLLKAADELHALYCTVVRDGSYPPQLVGSSLFRSAAEAPVRTMQVLSQRIMPYYAWAKSYRLKNETKSRLVGWLYSRFEKIMVQLRESWTAQTRFSDEEKAQLFIGYLAKFPESERAKQDAEEVEHAQ